ncbi:transposon, En/Spm-like, transposase-associated domain protein [Tanacetum coccineum]
MSARGDRGWMYKRRNSEGRLCSYYQSKVNEFLNFAFSIERVVERKTFGSDVVFRIKCSCSKCKIKVFKKRDEVKFDLWHNGFIRGYTTWYAHGERKCRRAEIGECSEPIEEDNVVGCTQVILDIHNATYLHPDTQEEQATNSFAKQYYEMLEAADKPRLMRALYLYGQGCQKVSSTLKLATSIAMAFLVTKKGGRGRNNVPNLVLTYFPMAHRLQRMYMSKKMSKEMTWHHDHKTDSNKMVHPSDGKAWKHFDSTHPTKEPIPTDFRRKWLSLLCCSGKSESEIDEKGVQC